MSSIIISLRKLFGKKQDTRVSAPDATDAELSQDGTDLQQEDITDRVIVKYGSSFDETPELAVGSLVKISRFKRDNDQIYESGELLLGGEKLVDFSKITSKSSGKTLLRHVVDRKISAEVGFLSFANAAMDAQALAEAEITQAVTATIPASAIKTDEFYNMIKDTKLPDHQYLAIVLEAAVIISSVKIFNKIEGSGQAAAYGFTLKGSAYSLSEFLSNRSFLAVTPRRHYLDTRDITSKPVTEKKLINMTPKFSLNNVSQSVWIRNKEVRLTKIDI